jgi:N-acyl homoserine lactone hydrolase
MKRILRLMPPIAAFAALAALSYAPAQQKGKAQPPKSMRLYILDCGNITGINAANFGFKEGELKDTEMFTPCYLIAHPRGTLMWDVGEIPDGAFKGDGQPAKQGAFTVARPLLPQLAALGYTPADITYLGLSHYHGDHVANANLFASSTWLVQEVERNAMFAPQDGKTKNAPNLSYVGNLKDSKTTIIRNTDHDVFGDGSVVIKFTPGHTPGHQSLFLKLAKTGPVVLSGDLYHYPEEMTLKRIPAIEFNQEQTAKSRESLENFVKQQKAKLWIQHDAKLAKTLKKAPEFYE